MPFSIRTCLIELIATLFMVAVYFVVGAGLAHIAYCMLGIGRP